MIQETDEITHVWQNSPAARVPPSELILVTDFDGTLAEIVPDPTMARARPEALEAIQELVTLLADVIVLSSRTPDQLESLMPISGVRLIGDSGLALPRLAVGVWSPEAPADLFERCDLVVPGPVGATAVLQEIVEWARNAS